MKLLIEKDKHITTAEIIQISSMLNIAAQGPDTFHMETTGQGVSFCLSEPVREKVISKPRHMQKKAELKDMIAEIITYLNVQTGRAYSYKAKSNIELITPRILQDGYTVDQFKKIIDNKIADWTDDPKMSKYIRPETIFSKKHFESYLNEVPAGKQEEDLFAELESYGPGASNDKKIN